MKITAIEMSVFRAVVKGIGIYQLVVGAGDFFAVLLSRSDIKRLSIGIPTRDGEYLAWAIFHFGIALFLLFATGTACRLAFSKAQLEAAARTEVGS